MPSEVEGVIAFILKQNPGDLDAKYVYVNGLLCAMLKATGERYYFHHDGLASTIGVVGTTDGQSAVVQSYIYDEFGKTLIANGTLDNHYLYTGQEWDPAPASLYNLRARMYDPNIGRFLSEDPLGLEAGVNSYTYCLNNPVNLTDPLGLFWYKTGVPRASPELEKLLLCVESCMGKSLLITSTSEPIEQHKPGDPHRRGDAADVAYIPGGSSKFMCCAAKCGAHYALDERKHPSKGSTAPHFHIQIPSGKRGGQGDLPQEKPCGDCPG